jgi:hypothetical protein
MSHPAILFVIEGCQVSLFNIFEIHQGECMTEYEDKVKVGLKQSTFIILSNL